MKQYLRPGVAIIGLVLLLIGAFRLSDPSPSDSLAKAQPSQRLNAQAATATKTSAASETIRNQEFAQHIDRLIDQSPFAAARWGVKVVAVANGATVYERNARQQFIPASNMKIYTTAAALDLLGADYRWQTSAYALTRPDAAGTIDGDLILYGRGAPDLVTDRTENSLAKLADAVHARGVRRVKGSVIGDESYFRGSPIGDGWQWNDLQWYFGAEASALTVNGNEVDLNLLPPAKGNATPEVRSGDRFGYVQVDNRMAPGNRAARSTIGVARGLSDNRIEVWGELAPGAKGFGVRLSVHNPALWAARTFVAALKDRNITVDGGASARSSRSASSQRFEPTQASEIASVTSAPLSDIARATNKESNNLYAELILRTLGRERRSMLSTPEPPDRERGDEEAGTELIRVWLERNGIATNGTAFRDGSGLSRLNLVTPEGTAQMLNVISRSGSQSFRESLPIAGKDGTLGGRLKTLTGRAFAKTGSLIYVNSLSGYVLTANGETLAFAIFCNDYVGRSNSSRLIDDIVVALAAYPETSR
ncbi:MAG TPA: D-alanyl-D-alanine carboxypeptidase/D-alanyl-D-alanine-endopeptidase [Pyrinomonadaceae bacterium]|nr:D-alanyl-D-alanine carboxypeptidase/D-alanyl-D-alanine-endopeptidase [Pyrinomonadaceae bacterium]